MHETPDRLYGEMHILGAYWIFLALLQGACFLGLVQSHQENQLPQRDVAFLYGSGAGCIVWLVVGIATYAKQVWAVYPGLVLTYLSLGGNIGLFILDSTNVLKLIVCLVIFLLAARARLVLRLSAENRSA